MNFLQRSLWSKGFKDAEHMVLNICWASANSELRVMKVLLKSYDRGWEDCIAHHKERIDANIKKLDEKYLPIISMYLKEGV